MNDSEGNLKVFRSLLRDEKKPKPQEIKKQRAVKPTDEEEAVFPWGNKWLSVHNPYLFRGF